jgi:3-hydroxyisobutyrate dehydrogenase-like beta-hydroxyacid dehydrogenase
MRKRTSPVIGMLHPGEMGSAVGRCLAARGHTVLWASHGRGPRTADRARSCGLRDVGTAVALAGQADVIFSVCPPDAALDVAGSVPGFRGTYVDANAVSPQTARDVAAIVEGGGASYVDGGIIGPPPASPGGTRLYLSGPASGSVRSLFDGTAVDARLARGDIVAASSVKMAYAAWTKGSAALLLAVRALADADGVSDVLLAEWELSQPGLLSRSRGAAESAAAKGWRWTGEMEEIAATMGAAGLPPGFHLAAAEIFRQYGRTSSAGSE